MMIMMSCLVYFRMMPTVSDCQCLSAARPIHYRMNVRVFDFNRPNAYMHRPKPKHARQIFVGIHFA